MRIRLLAGLGVGLAFALAAGGATQARQAAPQVAPAPLAVRALIDDYVATAKVPGIVVGIGHGDAPPHFLSAGKIAFEPGAPDAGPDSLWRVYSMTKPITGIAAMILVEEGKIRLDQPISDFIPAFKDVRVLDTPDGDSLASHPAQTPITVRHLLTHTSGLGYTIISKGAQLKQYQDLGLVPAALGPATEPGQRTTRPPTLEAFANQVAKAPLAVEPGTRWGYSIGLDVMGRVIEVASGMPFDAFLQKRLFDPLKMTSTYFTVPKNEVGRLSTNYMYMMGGRTPIDPGSASIWLAPPSFPYGGAGLVSSARDYDRFLHMLLNEGQLDGGRVLKPETVRLAMSNLLPAGADTSALGPTSGAAGKLGFGAGGSVYLADLPDGPSKGTFGWGGAAGTLGWVDPVRKIRGTLMVNYMPITQFPLRADLNKALFADFARR